MNRKLVALFLVVITLCAPFVSVYGQGLRTHEHAPPVIDMPAENAYERREVETRGDVPLEDALSQSNISENLESGAVLYEGFSFEMIELPTQTQTEIILEIPTSEREYSETVRSTCNRITYVYSEELSEIDIDATYKTYSGPETFCMTENGDICILDSGSKRIRVYDAESGNEIRTIELYNVNNPTEMITDGANFYVLDVVTSKIIAIDEAENRTEYKLPKVSESYYRPSTDTYDTFEYDMGPLVVELRINEGVLVVCAAQFGEYRLIDGEFVLSENVYNAVDDGEFFNISYGEYNWEIPSKAIGIEIKGVDNEGNIYLYCCSTLLDEKGMLTGDNTLRVYDKDSRLIKAALVDSEERFILPRHHIALGFDNEFYEMICEEDRVSIVRVIPTEDARIKETELSSMDNSVSNMDTASTEEVISNCAHTSFEDADTLAAAYSTHAFIISDMNRYDWDGNGEEFIVPSYILSADIGDLVNGIPYSRGDEDTLTEFPTLLNTYVPIESGREQVSTYYTAGNIESSSYHDKAIGVDCSGYAMNVYNTDVACGYRPASSDYYDRLGYRKTGTSYSTLANAAHRLDYWVKIGHIMVHAAYNSTTNTLSVYDATKTMTGGRVSYRSFSISSLSSGYILKSPWHSGDCTFEMDNNGTVHFMQCTQCGYTEGSTQHTWEYSSDASRHWLSCTVCGRTKSYASHTWSTDYDSSATQHWHYCTVCGNANTKASHTWGTTYGSNGLQHWVTCTVCSRRNYSDHTWVPMGAKYRCSVCGYISASNPGTASIPTELKKRRPPELY